MNCSSYDQAHYASLGVLRLEIVGVYLEREAEVSTDKIQIGWRMRGRNQRLRFIAKGSSVSLSRLALVLTAILYCAAQWKYASKIGPNKIFSSSRRIERADFTGMVDQLSMATQRVCIANRLSKLLFEDGDRALPYMETSGDRLHGCVAVRHTNVTPFSRSELDDCNVIYIREYGPQDEPDLRIHNTLYTSPWTEVERWTSGDEEYGFALYRHSCPANKNRDVNQNE
jgi:hypothetical protein